jgi:hypothetical protein
MFCGKNDKILPNKTEFHIKKIRLNLIVLQKLSMEINVFKKKVYILFFHIILE